MTLDEIYALFPNLKERSREPAAAKLSGGEQQMLAIARILRTGARFLVLDEPTEGLAPVIVQQIGVVLETIRAGHDRAAGGAEFPLRRRRRRPPLCHGKRQDRRS